MVSLNSIYDALGTEYVSTIPLNIYDSDACQALATQAIAARHFIVDTSKTISDDSAAIPIILVEDQYPGWLRKTDLEKIDVASTPYQPKSWDRPAIETQLPAVIDYTYQAMARPNEYLWGGTIGPNLDCSGLIQRAFGSVGIWLPRDAYQQEAFVETLPVSLQPTDVTQTLQAGDLIFFGPPEKATHVALYLGQGQYIHSSGKEKGRNGIGIDHLLDLSHPVSQTYASELRGAGRVQASFCP